MANLTTQNLAIAKLYTALFNRAPDAAGFAFWAQALANGASLDTLAQTMMTTPEAVAIYPAGQTSAQFVTAYYTSVFGRAPDVGGLAFWSAALDAQGGAGNGAARAALTMQISTIASTPLASKPEGMSDAVYNQTVADRARFINKTEFGVSFATELKSNDLTLAKFSLALVTDNASSLVAASNLANGITTPEPAPAPAPEPGMAITVADVAGVITSKFAAYAYSSATVDATGMGTDQLSAVAAAVVKIAVNGITGTFTLTSTQSNLQLAALLGAKASVAATVTVNASGMNVAQVVELGLGAAKIDSLSSLPIVQFSNEAYTDAVTAGLFAISAPGTMQLTGASFASEVELALIAANLVKVSTLAGSFTLTGNSSATTITNLLAARIGGMNILVSIDPAGMNTEKLAAVGAKLAGVSDVLVTNMADAATITTLLALPGMNTMELRVDTAGMSSAQIDAVADGAGSIRSLSFGASLDASLISTLLSAPNMGPVDVTASAAGMSTAQLVALGVGAANVDKIESLPRLLLGDALITDAVTAGLLSKAIPIGSDVTVTATDASAAEVTSLLSYLSKVADRGINGTLNLGVGDLPSITQAALSPKLAVGATVSVTGTATSDTINLSAWSMALRVDGGAGADRIVLGSGADTVFIGAQGATQSAAALTDTDTSKIETIANFSSSDVIRLSTAAGVFGEGLAFRAGAITLSSTTNAVDIVTMADLLNTANGSGAVASTSEAPVIRVINAYFYNAGVTPGGLANKTYFILNDANPEFTLDDTIIAVENYITTIGVGTAKFEAGV